MAEQVPDNQPNVVPDPQSGSGANASSSARLPDNLDHLLPPSSVETPLYKALIDSIKELINPPKLPPLEVTSKPYNPPSMKGLYGGNEWKAGAASVGINLGIIGLLLLIGATTGVIPIEAPKELTRLVMPPPPKPFVAPPKKQTSGGGGGSPTKVPDSKGELPKVAPRTFIPTVRTVENPQLPMTPTIIDAPDINISASNIGNPLAGVGVPSNGTGSGGGIGPGKGKGVGPGTGDGYGGGAFRIGGGVSAPVALTRPEPEYSEEARKAKHQGEVRIALVVDEKGHPQNMRVVKKLGLGLDEKALEAVAKWVFKPGMKDGRPVPVEATVAVTFRLL